MRRTVTRPRPTPLTARLPVANRINRRTATRSERSPTRNSSTTSPAGPGMKPGTQRRRPSATLTPRKSSAGTTASGSIKCGAARPAPPAGGTPAPRIKKEDAALRPVRTISGRTIEVYLRGRARARFASSRPNFLKGRQPASFLSDYRVQGSPLPRARGAQPRILIKFFAAVVQYAPRDDYHVDLLGAFEDV